MIWKNPFLIRQTEKIDSETQFLYLFSADTLKIFGENSLNTIQFIRSSPGAGKTTIFKALSSNVLSTLNNLRDNDNFKDFFKLVADQKIIENGQVKLLSCLVSCAKNYDIIDEIFQNGRRQQVLFALLNVRITILALKSIMNIKSLQSSLELKRVTFKEFPEEFALLEENITNGQELYEWARNEEKIICDYIDRLSDEKTNFTFYYNSLFLLKLFEPYNIEFDHEKMINHTIIFFDDMQKLTNHQRRLLIESLYTMRPNIGIWIGERLEALTNKEIISSDATEGREFNKIVLEEYWQKYKNDSNFYKILTNIADRRVQLSYSDTIGNFMNCIDNSIKALQYDGVFNDAINQIKMLISNNLSFKNKYKNIFSYLENNVQQDLYKRAIEWKCLEILYKREQKGQLSLDLEELYPEIDFEDFVQKNKSAAEFYLCIQNKIPYYYGMEKLMEISSFNIEQFLSFAGLIFEKSIAKMVIQTGKTINCSINPEDQEKYIKDNAERKWDDILQRFLNGGEIQNLLYNLCLIALETRNKWTNSYSGGSITGIGIEINEIKDLEKDRYFNLAKIISQCIASNYFEKRIIEHSNKKWVVLYFNRWLCVKYDLPLKYGGWRRIKINKLNQLYKKKFSMDSSVVSQLDQLNLLDDLEVENGL